MAIALPQYDSLRRLRRKYGPEFPDLSEKDPKVLAQQWRTWLSGQREVNESSMRDRRLHWGRHRNFRVSNQHISSKDGRTWREPSADKNTIRCTNNLIGPALAFRHGVIAEQRPGFRHELLKATIEAREVAEAQQAVADHYFHKQNVMRHFKDAWFHAQTDGVAFIQAYVDKYAGPKVQNARKIPPTDERFAGLVAQGHKPGEDGIILLALSDAGDPLPPDAEISDIAEGDLCYRVVLAHDTFVDPEARVLNGEGDAARWFIVRRPRDLKLARIETNNDQLEAETLDTICDPADYPAESQGYSRGLPPFPSTQRTKYKESVYDWTLYIKPDGEDIEHGLWRRIIGDTLVDGADELPGGVYPFARITDGSTDPSFYPRPVMSDWIAPQITLNALESLLVQTARLGQGRLMGIKGTLLNESYNQVVGSFLEYEGMKPELLQPLRSSSDVWELRGAMVKTIENLTGHNDLARGQVLGEAGGGMQDVSGRAVLGAREMLERTFGPMAQAAAEGATEWAEVTVKLAAWLFGDTGRMIPTVGGRGDLAKKVTRDMLAGDCAVYVDPATMMPQPAQLRQQILVDLLDKGRITLAEYQKRAPYAELRNVYMGDIDHHQRAQWVNSLLEERWEEMQTLPAEALYGPDNGMMVLWPDDAVVHLNALAEITLNERKPWGLRKLALDRATIYEQLGQAKVDPMQPVPLEVLGVPLNRLRGQAAATGLVAPPTNAQPAAVAPGAEAAAIPPGQPGAQQDTAQPLGSFGSVEAASQASQQL